MIKTLTLLAYLLPAPLAALTLDQMLGSWAGEGVAVQRGESGVRFSCRIRLQPESPSSAVFSGRCATTQGQQSFTYLVIERADGTVTAQNRSQPADSLPLRLNGTAGADYVQFQDGAEQMFELRLMGAQLRLRIQGNNGGHPTRGEAFLARRN